MSCPPGVHVVPRASAPPAPGWANGTQPLPLKAQAMVISPALLARADVVIEEGRPSNRRAGFAAGEDAARLGQAQNR
jgi:hypothetical protein